MVQRNQSLVYTENVLLLLTYFYQPSMIIMSYCFNDFFTHLIIIVVSLFRRRE